MIEITLSIKQSAEVSLSAAETECELLKSEHGHWGQEVCVLTLLAEL